MSRRELSAEETQREFKDLAASGDYWVFPLINERIKSFLRESVAPLYVGRPERHRIAIVADGGVCGGVVFFHKADMSPTQLTRLIRANPLTVNTDIDDEQVAKCDVIMMRSVHPLEALVEDIALMEFAEVFGMEAGGEP